MQRPPMSKFISTTMTEAPFSRAAIAASSPPAPAPMTTTSASRSQAMASAARAVALALRQRRRRPRPMSESFAGSTTPYRRHVLAADGPVPLIGSREPPRNRRLFFVGVAGSFERPAPLTIRPEALRRALARDRTRHLTRRFLQPRAWRWRPAARLFMRWERESTPACRAAARADGPRQGRP